MLNALLIGQSDDLDVFTEILGRSRYFRKMEQWKTKTGLLAERDDHGGFDAFHAYLIVSPLEHPQELFSFLIRRKENLYFVDQPVFREATLNELDLLHRESGNILQPGVPELFHPLTEEFLTSHSSHLFFRYTKSVASRKMIRPAILSALAFLALLSPMPVKRMDVNTIDSTRYSRPHIKIRLKLFDSSISYIIIRMESTPEHSIIIESADGNFTFNFAGNYLENIHGARFLCDPVPEHDLWFKSLESFALNIILNQKPLFTLNHYRMCFHVLDKLQNIL